MSNASTENHGDNQSFEEMLNESFQAGPELEAGTRVKAHIVQITDEFVFCDIGAKKEAVIKTSEILDDQGDYTASRGDDLDAIVVSTRGDIELTTAIGKGVTTKPLLRMAWAEKIPVSGTVAATTKGGLSVNLGGIRAFCPRSQIDTRSVQDMESLVGQNMVFLISRYEEGGRNIILSRRDLLEEEQAKRKEVLEKTLKQGDQVTGTVQSTRDFGIFIDLQGFEALVPRSELSWSRSVSPSHFNMGQEVTAQVLAMDWENDRLSLSIKALSPDPWESIDNFKPGQELQGTVTNLIKAGAIVEIAEGLEGFIHVSRMSLTKRVNRPEDVLSRGDRVMVTIDSIDKKERKISLILKTGEKDPWLSIDDSFAQGTHTAMIESVSKKGLGIRLENGMDGFVPVRELKNSDGDIQKTYATGSQVTLAVKDMVREDRRLILSERLADQEREREEFRQYSGSDEPAGSSLGAMFKDTFEQLKKDVSG